MSDTYDRVVVARKRHHCDNFSCHGWIEPGDEYVRTVMFPGDVNSSDHPWVMRISVPCWTQYGRPLPSQPATLTPPP